MNIDKEIKKLFQYEASINGNFISIKNAPIIDGNQEQTCSAFSKKWEDYEKNKDKEKLYNMQKEWYLNLYGFKNENELKTYLNNKKIIFDAGCGLGFKTAWFAELSPGSIIIGMDLSDGIDIAAENYKHIPNLYFIKGSIAETGMNSEVIDYISCDQVLHHTEDPETTFNELNRVLVSGGELSVYVYRKKALPRELVDDFFRKRCKELSHDELLDLSKQVTELGKILSELEIEIEVPDIPALEIKGGKYDIQRFIYWNFLKCYWNKDLGFDISVSTNFDWYSPSNAKRFSKDEFINMIRNNNLEILHIHEEEACYSSRTCKP